MIFDHFLEKLGKFLYMEVLKMRSSLKFFIIFFHVKSVITSVIGQKHSKISLKAVRKVHHPNLNFWTIFNRFQPF